MNVALTTDQLAKVPSEAQVNAQREKRFATEQRRDDLERQHRDEKVAEKRAQLGLDLEDARLKAKAEAERYYAMDAKRRGETYPARAKTPEDRAATAATNHHEAPSAEEDEMAVATPTKPKARQRATLPPVTNANAKARQVAAAKPAAKPATAKASAPKPVAAAKPAPKPKAAAAPRGKATEIVAWLKANKGEHTVTEVAKGIEHWYNATNQTLKKLAASGEVRSINGKPAKYAAK